MGLLILTRTMSLTEKDIPQAVDSLRQIFKSGVTRDVNWRKVQLNAFMRMLVEGRTEIEEALHADLKKSPTEAYVTEINQVMHEVQHMIDNLDHLMAPRKMKTDMMNLPGDSFQYADPLGVVLVVGAWNYPWLLTMFPVVGAIAAGNAVLIKVPSQHYTEATSKLIGTLVARYLDCDAIKVAFGDREMTQAVIRERYDIIFYTGGSYVGQMVAESAAKHLTPTILELGGKSPCIIDKSADITVAARRSAWGAFGLNNGQTCVRPDYVLVHEDIAEKYLQTVEKTVRDFYGTDASVSDSYSRVVNQRAAQRLGGIIDNDRRYVRFGGTVNIDNKYVEPTCLDFKGDTAAFTSSKAMEDEIFGPIMPVLRYRNLEDVIAFITKGEKPLALYVFTTTNHVAEKVLAETSSGGAVVNDVVTHLANGNLPFGGVGKSGMGSYHGNKSFESFSHMKSVLKKTNWFDAPQRYPPYKRDAMLEMALAPIPEWKAAAARRLMMLITAVLAITLMRGKRGRQVLALLQQRLKDFARRLAQ